MLLLLIRHALAAEHDPARWPDDALRPLVPKGRKRHARMARALGRAGYLPERVYSSPWKRAWQTARITVEELGLDRSARVRCDALAAPPDLGAFARDLGDPAPDSVLALVGHEPWMSELAALLLAGSAHGLSIDFAKSAVLGIEADGIAPRAGTLRFFWHP